MSKDNDVRPLTGGLSSDGSSQQAVSPVPASIPDADMREVLALGYRELSGVRDHWSDCAIHNAPAYVPGPCDCPAPAKPMWSAPKDGTEILVAGGTYESDQDCFSGMAHKWDGWAIVRWVDGWQGEQQAHDAWLWHDPLCWHPLPELNAQAMETRKGGDAKAGSVRKHDSAVEDAPKSSRQPNQERQS